MISDAVRTRCEALIRACLDETNARGTELQDRLDVLTKVTRYMEATMPRMTIVRHIHDSAGSSVPLSQTATDPDPAGGLRK